jgi:trehalose 6-phosphate phosphatase
LTLAELDPVRRRPGAGALLFDVDGTLAPIVARAEEAAVPDEVRALLAQLVGRYALVACVSGRRAADARRLVGVDGIAYAGNHGYELLTPNAGEPQIDTAVQSRAELAATYAAALDREQMERLGVRLEDKGPIQALHWRGAPDEAAAAAFVERIGTQAERDGLVIHRGRKVLELRPVAGIDKGSAVRALLDDADDVAAALYAGDDRTDLDAFRALRDLVETGRLEAAVCVGVASAEGPQQIGEEADLVIDGAEAMASVLAELAG